MKNNFLTKLSAVALAGVMALTFAPAASLTAFAADAATATKVKTTPVYRSYNPNNGEHLLTIEKSEHDDVVKRGYTDEGEGWDAPETGDPVYRVYNPNSGEHLLIASKKEYDNVVLKGWNGEGIKMYSDTNNAVPIYRVFNPNARDAGSHLYTAKKSEYDDLVSKGWSGEGIAFYGAGKKEEATKVVSAKQTSANTAEVTLSKELGEKETLTVTRGTSEVSISAKSNEGTVYTLTFASKLVKDTYKAVVTHEDKTTSEASFSADAVKLTKINWLSDTLNVKSNTAAGMKEVATYVKGEDQWGNEMAITGATWTASTGTPAYNAQTGKLTITHTDPYTIGSTVTVICVIQDKAIAENHNFKVGMADSVASLELGELTTDNADYKDLKDVTEKALENASYYIPVTAKDAAGIELSESDLTAMLGSTLFVTPNNTATTGVLYFNGFTTKNGKPAMKIVAGTTCTAGGTDFDLVADMPTVISVLSTGEAGSVTKNVTIYRSPVIKDMTVTLPSDLYAGKKSEFTVSATDQNGNAINMYDYAVAGAVLRFKDGTALTTTNGTIAVTIDKSKKTVKFEITPDGTAAGMVSITGTTKGLGSVIVNAQYQGSRSIDSVSSLNKDLKTTIMKNAPAQTMGKPVLSWNDGVALSGTEMTAAEGLTLSNTVSGKVSALKGAIPSGIFTIGGASNAGFAYAGTATDVNPGDYGWTQSGAMTWTAYGYAYTLSDSDFVSFGNTTATCEDWTLSPVAAGTATLTTHLYKIEATITAADVGTYKVTEINTLKTDITVQAEKAGQYVLEAEKTADKTAQALYVGSTNDTLKLTLTTASGAAVDQSLLQASNVTFTCDDTSMDATLSLTPGAQPVVATTAAASWGKNKTANVTVTATIAVAGDTEIVTTTFPVTTVAPKATEIAYYAGSANATYALNASATKTDTSDVSFTASNKATDFKQVFVVDQYGNDIILDGGAAASITVVNAKDASADGKFATGDPVVTWNATDGTSGLLKVSTDSNPALAAGDTFDVIIQSGTVSRTFHVTIATPSTP